MHLHIGRAGLAGAHRASGSGRSWNFTTFGREPLPVSRWNGVRVPYPTGFYTKWMDGRIDDAKAGWKGKGLWATISTRTPFHMETGKGTTSKVMHFQLRPDTLAK